MLLVPASLSSASLEITVQGLTLPVLDTVTVSLSGVIETATRLFRAYYATNHWVEGEVTLTAGVIDPDTQGEPRGFLG